MIRYIILLQIDMYLVQMIQVKITCNIVMITEKKATPGEDESYEYLCYIARARRDHGTEHNIYTIGS